MDFSVILVLDIVIVILLIAVFFRIGNDKGHIKKMNVMHINNLKKSLEGVMKESEKISKELMDSFDKRITVLKGLHGRIYSNEKSLESNIIHAEEIIKSIDEKKSTHLQNNSEDPYKLAIDLILQGKSAEDIQKKCGLSLNEIDLIKQLSSHRANGAQ
jgi:uncharacterized protein DUF2802